MHTIVNRLSLLLLIFVLLINAILPSIVFAETTSPSDNRSAIYGGYSYYDANDVLTSCDPATGYYDGNIGDGGAGSLIIDDSFDWRKPQIEKNKLAMWQFLIGKGLTPIQTAGWMANIWAESGYYAPKLEGRYGDDYEPLVQNEYNDNYTNVPGLDYDPSKLKNGFGLVQWTNTQGDEKGRRYKVFETAKKQGKDPLALSFQLEYMWYDLTVNYKDFVYKYFKEATTLQEAHDIILLKYERPGEEYANKRKISGPIEGEALLKQFAGVSGGSIGGCAGNGYAGVGGWDVEGPNAMTFYSQNDPKYADHKYGTRSYDATIQICGCGPTSMAMVVANLNSNKSITPITTADYFMSAGIANECGTDWVWGTAAKNYGLTYTSLANKDGDPDFSKAAEILNAGGLIIGSFGIAKGSPTYFTSGRHLMVIRKVDESGKFYIADPIQRTASAVKNTTGYTESFLLSRNSEGGALNMMWGFTK